MIGSQYRVLFGPPAGVPRTEFVDADGRRCIVSAEGGETCPVQRLLTTYSTVVWSPDGGLVTKSARLPAHDARRRYRYEERMNRLLLTTRVPVRTATCVGSDRHRRTLTFEAINGSPLGPKYPAQLEPAAIDAMLDLITPLRSYRPRRRWLRRFDSHGVSPSRRGPDCSRQCRRPRWLHSQHRSASD